VLTPVNATPGKTINQIECRIFNNSGGNLSMYVGGLDVRVGQDVDGFVHGAAGVGYSWESTANNSPSNRAAFTPAQVIGSGGSVYPSIRLYVVSRQNQILREITDHFIDGDVGYDMDADNWKGSCRLILDDPTLIEPLAMEFVRIVLRLDYPDGTSEEGPLGQFMVDLPSERWNSGDDQWTYQGKDLLAVLAQSQARGPYPVAAGRSYQSIVDDVLYTQALLHRDQVALPPLTQVFGYNWSWERGSSFLKIINDLYTFAGYQRPWINPAGLLTTAVAGTNPAVIPPAITFSTGYDSKVRWPFQVDPDTSGVGNRVSVVTAHTVTHYTDPIVIGEPDSASVSSLSTQGSNPAANADASKKKKKKKKKPGQTSPPPPADQDPADLPGQPYDVDEQLVSIRVNNDPAHPISVVRLGRFIDVPDINVPLVADQAAADALANNALIQASVLPMRARLTTVVMLRGLNEVYELNLMDSHGNPIDSGQGRYFCRGWTLQLGLPWEMVHTLTRVIAFTSTPYF
jgi:hypothetical protein